MGTVMEERYDLNPQCRTKVVDVPDVARMKRERGTTIDRQLRFQSPACWHLLRCWTEV